MNRKIPFHLQAFGTNDVNAFFRFKTIGRVQMRHGSG